MLFKYHKEIIKPISGYYKTVGADLFNGMKRLETYMGKNKIKINVVWQKYFHFLKKKSF
jgi:hypothetical protein